MLYSLLLCLRLLAFRFPSAYTPGPDHVASRVSLVPDPLAASSFRPFPSSVRPLQAGEEREEEREEGEPHPHTDEYLFGPGTRLTERSQEGRGS